MKKIIDVLRHFHRIYYNICLLIKDKSFYSADSYFPEFEDKRKTINQILIDQLKNIFRCGAVENYYFHYGLDIKGLRNSKDYINANLMIYRRDELNRQTPNNHVCILRDKALFGIFAETYNIPTPHNIGLVKDGEIYEFSTKEKCSFKSFIFKNDVDAFLKLLDGQCADGVFHIEVKNNQLIVNGNNVDFNSWAKSLERGVFLMQKSITNQHPAISNIHPYAINTIRLITIRNIHTKEIEFFPPILRIGTGKSHVDNTTAGGIAVGINTENNVLREFGFMKPGHGTKTTKHPNSGVVFKDYHIPFLQEAISLSKSFHNLLPDIHSIGWDIAITEEGPIFIEGNDNWEISSVQACNHGLFKEYKRLFY